MSAPETTYQCCKHCDHGDFDYDGEGNEYHRWACEHGCNDSEAKS